MIYPPAMPLLREPGASSNLIDDLGRHEVSAAVHADLTWPDREYELVIVEGHHVRPATNDVELWIRTSSDGGASFDAGPTDYDWRTGVFSTGVATETGPNSYIRHGNASASNGINNGVGYGAGLTMTVFRPFDTGAKTSLHIHGEHKHGGGIWTTQPTMGRRNAAGKVNGIRFLFSSGSIADGVFLVTGLRRR